MCIRPLSAGGQEHCHVRRVQHIMDIDGIVLCPGSRLLVTPGAAVCELGLGDLSARATDGAVVQQGEDLVVSVTAIADISAAGPAARSGI